MQLKFLKLPADERRLYFAQAASQRNLSPVILEKDFWVSWLLGVLFRSKYKDALTFKGGTSLSKVFGAIDRFSEDIDLSLSPEFLNLPEAGTSRTQAGLWMKNAEAECARVMREEMLPDVEREVAAVLGERDPPWLEYELDTVTHSPVLLFHYPSTQPTGFAYLRRSVKLELGSLTDQKPADRHPVRPWVAEVFPDGFDDWQCDVVALELERTFWEKATILHVEYYRPAEKQTPDRYSRHYADTAALAGHPRVQSTLKDHDLRDRVVSWKNHFFGSSWARYDLAKPGTFRLVPPSERLPALRRDYEAMRDMYLTEPMEFDQILAKLSDLENRINGESRA